MGRFLRLLGKKNRKTLFICLMAFCFLCVSFRSNSFAENDFIKLPKEIENWLDKIESDQILLENAVGQLFIVGTRSDWNNHYPKTTLDLVKMLQPGGFIVHNYNYLNNLGSNADKFATSQSFHRSLIIVTKEYSKTKIPPFIAADFECSSAWGSSLNGSGLNPPPSPLTLSASQDNKMVEQLGALIGKQLDVVGINMLLGPVIDLDRQNHITTKDTIKRNWRPRKFGATSQTVIATAGNYLTGLKAANIIPILKHFPGLGDYDVNLHDNDDIPQLIFSESDLLPFKHLWRYSSGFMTSHVAYDNKLITFNKDFIKDTVRGADKIGNNTTIVITDDLSDMGPILHYMECKKKGWPKVALDAFRSGHDLLLFAHTQGNGAEKAPTNEDLIKAKNLIIQEIESSPVLKQQFMDSLRRILYAKWNYWKNYNNSYSKFLNGKVTIPSRGNIAVEKGIEYKGEKIILNNDFLRKIHEKAFTSFEKKYAPIDFRDKKVSVFIPESVIKYFEGFFAKSDCRKLVTLPKKYENDDARNETWDSFVEELSKDDVDYVVVIPRTVEHYHMLDHVKIHHNELLQKIIILEHSSPKNISRGVALCAKVLGSFSWHPSSFLVDKAYLSGDIRPHLGEDFPISFVKQVPELNPYVMPCPSIIEPIVDTMTASNERLRSDLKRANDQIVKHNDEMAVLKKSMETIKNEKETLKKAKDKIEKILNDNKKNITAILFACILISAVSLQRQGEYTYGGKRGAIVYVIDSIFTKKDSWPSGVQEALSVTSLSFIGILFLFYPTSKVILFIGIALMFTPTLVGFIHAKATLYSDQSFRHVLILYLNSRFKNRPVLIFFVLGLFMLIFLNDSFFKWLKKFYDLL